MTDFWMDNLNKDVKMCSGIFKIQNYSFMIMPISYSNVIVISYYKIVTKFLEADHLIVL